MSGFNAAWGNQCCMVYESVCMHLHQKKKEKCAYLCVYESAFDVCSSMCVFLKHVCLHTYVIMRSILLKVFAQREVMQQV